MAQLDPSNVSPSDLTPEAVRALVHTLREDVVRFLDIRNHRHCPACECRGEDVLDDVCIKVLASYWQFGVDPKKGNNFRKWFFSVVDSVQRDCWRARRIASPDDPEPRLDRPDETVEQPLDVILSGEEYEERRQRDREVRTCLWFLEDLERRILVLTYYGDGVLKSGKVAEILAIPAAKVHSAKHSAHQKMKACLTCRQRLPPEQIASLDDGVSAAQPPEDSRESIEWMLSTGTAVKFPAESAEKLAKCIKNEGKSASPSKTGRQP